MTQERPNILIVTTDQQRTDTLSCYGSAFTSTPNLDRLAREGVLLDRAYCSNPVCTPARASIFSGLNVSRHGAWNTGLNVPDDLPLISHRLVPHGYRTHYIGKAHFHSFGAQTGSAESLHDWEPRYRNWHGPYYGFQSVELALGHASWGLGGHYGIWLRSQLTDAQYQSVRRPTPVIDAPGFGGEAYDWDLPTRLHNSVWTADRTVDFLDRCDRSAPFVLAVGFEDPHHPHCVPRDFDLRVDPRAVPSPAFTEGELDDKPPHFLAAREGRLEKSAFRGTFPVAGQAGAIDFRTVTDAAARLGRAYYYTLVRLIDREIGRILDRLDHLGLAANTIVIFTTDHGELLGDHGIWMKGPFHYEQLVRIPMIIRWPAGFASGLRTSALFSQVDIVPTLLAAAGIPCPGLDGLDASPLLRGQAPRVRDHALIECVDDPACLRLKTIVTGTRKLTWYAGRPDGELYDLEKDPAEKTNRWPDPAYAPDKARLLAMALADLEPLERRANRVCYA